MTAIKLKYISQIIAGQSPSGDSVKMSGKLPFLQGCADFGLQVPVPTKYCEEANKIIPKGAWLISVRAPVGKLNYADQPYGIGRGLAAIIPKRVYSSYLGYAILNAVPELDKVSTGSTYSAVSTSQIGCLWLKLPSDDNQKLIADFLDHETERVEQLIRKKENFILLIQEKKQVLSNQILDGSILKLDQSGDKGWFGSLPASWPTRRGKFLFKEAHGRSETGDEELLTVSHITGVTKRSEKDVNMFMAETTEGYKLVSKGDVIVNTMWAWMGAMGVSPHDGLISPSYGVYQPLRKHFEAGYLDLILRSKAFIAEATRRSKGIHSSRLRLYPDAFLDILFPVPSLDEQKQILSEYNRATAKEDKLVELNAKSIELLKEFRASLITEAVTGQLDIESWRKRGNTDERLDNIEESIRT
ncbi:TPA: restriction endonuclease subunit S [Legionella pneumophila]|nr:hypothetical protein [Legionella pneumophila]HAU0966037.1 hypothetical protein [Legionella pneumophila]HBB6939329.1 restriction endonuclease subunit S [Legionella pneumophila]HBD9219733.1 restriction endonuclease subunit S [Legionella pneumophila]